MKRALVLLVLLACSKSKAPSNELPSEAWGVEDYAKAGITIDKPWGAAEFKDALHVLRPETDGHRERLPHFRGAKSGAVFAKLTADMPADADRPVQERFGARFDHYAALNEISKLYVPNIAAAPPREWIELLGAQLREASVLASQSDALIASFGPDDPKRAARLEGATRMQAGFGNMILGGLMVVGDPRMPEPDRIAMVEHITPVLPVVFPLLAADSQRAIRDHITKLVDNLGPGKLHDAAVAAQKALP